MVFSGEWPSRDFFGVLHWLVCPGNGKWKVSQRKKKTYTRLSASHRTWAVNIAVVGRSILTCAVLRGKCKSQGPLFITLAFQYEEDINQDRPQGTKKCNHHATTYPNCQNNVNRYVYACIAIRKLAPGKQLIILTACCDLSISR